ncbi:MAG: hypothetical protein AMJ41_00035 [candidate division Zixibacteria bacterium DG_27]|nr:MAG: hypothetical protein AMJ41_00035 [candidate division Zixibacteria bacterium DG_27]
MNVVAGLGNLFDYARPYDRFVRTESALGKSFYFSMIYGPLLRRALYGSINFTFQPSQMRKE